MESNVDTLTLHKMFLTNRANQIIQYINTVAGEFDGMSQEIFSRISYDLNYFQARVQSAYSNEELLNLSQELIQREEDLGAMLPDNVPMSSSGIEEIDIRGDEMAIQRDILSVINKIDEMVLFFKQEGLNYMGPSAQNHLQPLFQRFNTEKQSFFSSPDKSIEGIASRLESFSNIQQEILFVTMGNMEKNVPIGTKMLEIEQRYQKICKEQDKLVKKKSNNMILKISPPISELGKEIANAQDSVNKLLKDWQQYPENSLLNTQKNNFQYLWGSFCNWLHVFKDVKMQLEDIDAKLKSVTAQLNIKEDATALSFTQQHKARSNETNINNFRGLDSFGNQLNKFAYGSGQKDCNNMFNASKSFLSPNSLPHCCDCQNCYNRTAPYCHDIMQNRNYPNMPHSLRGPMIGVGFGNDRFADEMRLRDYMNTMELHHQHDIDMINHRLNFENMLYDRDRFLEEKFDRKLGDLRNSNDIFSTPNGYHVAPYPNNNGNDIGNYNGENNNYDAMPSSYGMPYNAINNNAELVSPTNIADVDSLANQYLGN